MARRAPFVLTLSLLLLLSPTPIHSRPFSHLISLPSDDVDTTLLRSNSTEMCEETYGFLPCTRSALGNLVLMAGYGYLMYLAATFLYQGSELLLQILGPGIVGGLFLPILGSLPDALLVLASGLFASQETAQEQVLIGMGSLAGSTIMLLTMLWGTCVVVGKCDLSENSTSIDKRDTKNFNLVCSGVSTDMPTSDAAKILVLSIAPFFIVQIPSMFKLPSISRVMVLVALAVSVVLLISYCLYQIYQPLIQTRRIEYVKLKHVIEGMLYHVEKQSLGHLLGDDGSPNIDVLRRLFKDLDTNSDDSISRSELDAFVKGIQFRDSKTDHNDTVERLMKLFDQAGTDSISEDEFVSGVVRWHEEVEISIPYTGGETETFAHNSHSITQEENARLIAEGGEATISVEKSHTVKVKAALLLVLGTGIALLIADPLVDAVSSFSSATCIPSFFISFIFMPLATNSTEAVSSILFASQKTRKNASLTFSELYGSAVMNNTLCLAVFLALVYFKNLSWDFSSEVLVILLVCIVMGLFASFRTTFPLWTCIVAYLLYPLSLFIVYALDYVYGWK